MADIHQEAFRHEAYELLGELESSLLELERETRRRRTYWQGLQGDAYD